MKRKASFPAIIVILFVLGCIRSLHPLYEEKNLIFDPQLEGSWFSAEPSEKWVFDYEKEKSSVSDAAIVETISIPLDTYQSGVYYAEINISPKAAGSN